MPDQLDIVDNEIFTNPMQVLGVAIKRGVSPEALTQLSMLVKDWKSTMAKEAFGLAVSEFQQRCMPIVKARIVPKKDGSVRYKFAAFEDVWEVVGPLLAELKIGVSFSSPSIATNVFQTVCTLRVAGYSEAFPFTAPMPNIAKIAAELSIAEPAAFGVVLSYFKRYALCAALNIVVVGEDNDLVAKNLAGTEAATITEEQAKELGELLKRRKVNNTKFLDWCSEKEGFKVERLSQLSHGTYKQAKQEAEDFLAAQKGKAS